jgi:hypothetical protein
MFAVSGALGRNLTRLSDSQTIRRAPPYAHQRWNLANVALLRHLSGLQVASVAISQWLK